MYRIPRIAVDQYVFSQKISKQDLQPGDIIFSKKDRQARKPDKSAIDYLAGTAVPGGLSHLGIYVGEDKVIHATDPKGVIEENIAEASSFKEIVGYGRMSVLNERRWWIEVPATRLDIRIKEDVIEEIGRIYGFYKILGKVPQVGVKITPDKTYTYEQQIRAILTGLGFSELYTYAFVEKGEIAVANPIASDKGFLRTDLSNVISKSLEFNLKNADLLGLRQIKVFEIGRVFTKAGEHNSLCIGIVNIKGSANDEIRSVREILLEKLGANVQTVCTIDDTGGLLMNDNKQIGIINNQNGIMEINIDALTQSLPESSNVAQSKITDVSDPEVVRYKPFSVYPYMVRDIAIFVPGEQAEEKKQAVLDIIQKEGTDLLIRTSLFDVFTKTFKENGEIKTSYAYRLVFQSISRTLVDDEVNAIIQKMTTAMNSQEGWNVR